MKKFNDFYNAHKGLFIFITTTLLIILFILPFATTRRTRIDASYTDKEEVALYIMQYKELPPNYITHYGLEYVEKHNVESDGYFYIVGGDTHFNVGKLESFGINKSTKLKECDIAGGLYNASSSRGGQRLVYTCNTKNVRVFYTYDHYSSFVELKSFNLQIVRNIFWIIFSCYAVLFIAFYIIMSRFKKRAVTKVPETTI